MSTNPSCAFGAACYARRRGWILFGRRGAMTWLLMATGFSGGLTFIFMARRVHGWFVTPLTINVHHSPKGGCTDAIVAELKKARREILVQAYSFTSKPIAQALIEAKARGLH